MDISILDEIKGKIGAAGISKTALVGILVVLLIAGFAACRLFLGGTPASASEEIVTKESAGEEQEASEDVLNQTVFVHVSGAVVTPGLVEIPEGSRVDDAVNAAGGFAENAASDAINLAKVVEDGEQLKVPTKEEVEASASMQGAADATSAQGGSSPEQAGLVNINTATADQLIALPGVGESTAAKIVNDRASNGPFKTKEDLKRVSGIGDKKYEALADLICV